MTQSHFIVSLVAVAVIGIFVSFGDAQTTTRAPTTARPTTARPTTVAATTTQFSNITVSNDTTSGNDTDTDDDNTDDDGSQLAISPGGIVGIIIACLVVIGLLIFLLIWFLHPACERNRNMSAGERNERCREDCACRSCACGPCGRCGRCSDIECGDCECGECVCGPCDTVSCGRCSFGPCGTGCNCPTGHWTCGGCGHCSFAACQCGERVRGLICRCKHCRCECGRVEPTVTTTKQTIHITRDAEAVIQEPKGHAYGRLPPMEARAGISR